MELDQDHFFWGCGNPVQYGLYSPVVDRFLCVGNQYKVFEYVVFLMSAKIGLLIVPLHSAPNFEPDLVDNTCCTQWSVSNWPENSLDLKFNVLETRENFVTDTCGVLTQRPAKDLIDIQNFILLSCYVVRLFKVSNNYQYLVFSNLIELPFDDWREVKNIEKQCYQTIYLGSNYCAAKAEIEQLCQNLEQIQ